MEIAEIVSNNPHNLLGGFYEAGGAPSDPRRENYAPLFQRALLIRKSRSARFILYALQI